ncbi:MAG: serine protease [Ruminococcaceae bacterium]|nr:serine protease [Oscillospiraceae bacterium]
MKNKKFAALFLTAITALNFTACNQISSVDMTKDFTPEQMRGKAADDAFISSQLEFSLRLFKEEYKQNSGNLLISPLSLTCALALTANGAEGETLEQIESIMGGLPLSELNEYLYTYRSSLSSGEGFKLHSANSIWFKDEEKITFRNEFLQTDVNYFSSEIYKADFDASTAADINNWANKNTGGMIKKAVDKIDPEAVMYLINALAFDAEWAKIYEKSNIKEGSFTAENGEKREAEMMYSEESVYLEDENAIGFMKRYKGGKYSFAALLPNEGTTISEYLDLLSAESLQELLKDFRYCEVTAAVPKFKYECDFSLSDTLKSFGVTDAFDRFTADFSKMAEINVPNYNLYINDVLQKNFIEVNEKGTKAGAVTSFHMNLGCTSAGPPEKRVILDRPFVYMIVDNENYLPIFMGALTDIN